MKTKSKVKRNIPKFILSGVLPLTGENFMKETDSLDKVIEVGMYMVIGHNVGVNDGLPIYNSNNKNSFNAQLIVTSSGVIPYSKQETVGQMLIMSDSKKGRTNIFTRSWNADESGVGNWTSWLAMLSGDITIEAENYDLNEKLSALLNGLNNGTFIVKKAEMAKIIDNNSISKDMLITSLQNAISVVDNLKTQAADMPLSANQGVLLGYELQKLNTEELCAKGTFAVKADTQYDWTLYCDVSINMGATFRVLVDYNNEIKSNPYGMIEVVYADEPDKKYPYGANLTNGIENTYTAIKDIVRIYIPYSMHTTTAGVINYKVTVKNSLLSKFDEMIPKDIFRLDVDYKELSGVNRGGREISNAYCCCTGFIDVSNYKSLHAVGYNYTTFLLLSFYDKDKNHIDGYDVGDLGSTVPLYINQSVMVPESAVYARFTTCSSYKDRSCLLAMTTRCYDEDLNSVKKEIAVKYNGNRTRIDNIEERLYSKQQYSIDDLDVGNIKNNIIGDKYTEATLSTFYKGKFLCESGDVISIDTTGGQGDARGLAFSDRDGCILWCADIGCVVGDFTVPEGAKIALVNCVSTYSEKFSLAVKSYIGLSEENYSVPQIADTGFPCRCNNDSPLRILCFGSSWFMNTWWYMNKLLFSSGISYEMNCFFSSGAQFSQWVSRYEGLDEPEDSDLRLYSSVDGSDWSVLSIADNPGLFKEYLETGYDLIVFQQGAYQSIDWDEWECFSRLVSYVKRNSLPNSVIAFNNTWTPNINGVLSPFSNTEDGQSRWQKLNNQNCMKFASLSGISKIIPNGAAIWTLRNDGEITDDNDFTNDLLHLKNGLPLYLTALNFFETLITPMYGIRIDDIFWYPTEETQKCPASGESWLPVDDGLRSRLIKIVRLAQSDRFALNEL